MQTGLDLKALAATIADRVIRKLERKDARMKAWVYQRGESWYVGWREPAGRKRGKGYGAGAVGKKLAAKERDRLHAELTLNIYGSNVTKTWDEFVEAYKSKVLATRRPGTRAEAESALATFKRITKIEMMARLTTETVDEFAAARSAEKSRRRKGGSVSAATVNKELRHLKAAFRKASKWTYIKEVPDFAMVGEMEREPSYVTPDDFTAIYGACPSDWWRALVVTAYMTGWRISQLLNLKRADVDLKGRVAVTRAETAKGKRDARKPLHETVVEHLAKLPNDDSEFMFPVSCHRRTLDDQLHAICKNASVRAYGFHDFRRGFATMNADRISQDALQALMEHRSYQTTKKYIAVARQLRPANLNLFVPEMETPRKQAL